MIKQKETPEQWHYDAIKTNSLNSFDPSWTEITEEDYNYSLNVLPPIYVIGVDGFLMSEFYSGNITAGFIELNGRYFGKYVVAKHWSLEVQELLEELSNEQTA